MSIINDTELINQGEFPRKPSKGVPFNRAMILLAMLLIILFLIAFLSRVPVVQEQPSPKSDNIIASFFTPEIQYWVYKIVPWSKQYGLDPNLIATVMQIESCGHPQALSTAGAIGLFQVMPYHFSNDDDPYKPNINARRGLTYFQQALTAGDGDIRLAFAGYNGGINGARSPESNWPAETLRFVYWGMQIYEDASKGKSRSDRLDEWLTAGGASLCEAASIKLGLYE